MQRDFCLQLDKSIIDMSKKADVPPPGWAPLKPTKVLDTYWRFAAERQRIFFARCHNTPPPWTNDPILHQHKFTNAYRASDRVSQFLIRNVIYAGDQSAIEVFFRIILFKIFNRIDTWQLLEEHFGEIRYKDFKFKQYDKILSDAMNNGERIYSAAYIMPSGGRNSDFARKHQMHLSLIQRMIESELPERISECRNMRDAFEMLLQIPTFGEFLSYQYVTDLNYSNLFDFSEMSFVCAGPGAKDGIRKCFTDTAGLNEAEVIKLMADRQESEFERLGLTFYNLWGRRLQLIDCQNLFCEVDKYSRVAHPEFSGITGRTRIKQKFRPHQRLDLPWYPPKWGINERITKEE